jgi:tagatose-1,6-bisphosphate aldolase non-catalytic subunit AgaZ/GatZ
MLLAQGVPANLKVNKELTLAHQEELYSLSRVEENRYSEAGSQVAAAVADIMPRQREQVDQSRRSGHPR